MLNNLNGWHLLIILAVVLLLFGAPKLPGLARSVGQSMRIFKSEVKTMNEEDDTTAKRDVDNSSSAATTTSSPVTPPESSTKP